MPESNGDPRIDGMRLESIKKLFQEMQDVIIAELKENWDGHGDFTVGDNWDCFVFGIAKRLGPELVRDLEDRAFRDKFEYMIRGSVTELLKRGLLKLRNT